MGKPKTVEELFKGRHFDREVVILCVRWYLRFKLSLRDLVEMMAERGLSMAHTTIMRWVQRYAPEFEKRWRRFARAVPKSGIAIDEPRADQLPTVARNRLAGGGREIRTLGLSCDGVGVSCDGVGLSCGRGRGRRGRTG